MFGGSAAVNIPDTAMTVFEQTGELHPEYSVPLGAAASLLDTILPARMLKALTPKQLTALAASTAAKSGVIPGRTRLFLTDLSKSMAAEGGTEGTQTVLQEAAAYLSDPKQNQIGRAHV